LNTWLKYQFFELMIGERLEEARKRKGVSIREAAEATKIRGDFLMSMEDNSFDINLPVIYIRGFLKNYARYLHIDIQKALTDYDAQALGRKNGGPAVSTRQKRESFGQTEIDDEPLSPDSFSDEEDGEEPVTKPTPQHLTNSGSSASKRKAPPPPTLESEGSSRDVEAYNENKVLIVKGLIAFAGIFIIGLLLFVLFRIISGSSTPEINPEIAQPVATQSAQADTTSSNNSATSSVISPESFTITASDNVTLIVEQTMDRERLFSGSLNTGETISLEKTGAVSIRFSNGSAIVITSKGQRLEPNQSGVGRTVIQ
jgi:cytoskeletal protein RodZ